MTDEMFNNMQQEYNKEVEKLRNNEEIKKEIEELLLDCKVKRYALLVSMLEDNNIKSEDEIVSRMMLKYSPKNSQETNQIYYYFGTYKEINKGSEREYIYVSKDDKEAMYSEYANIETPYDFIKLPIKSCKKFEENKTIIDTGNTNYNTDEYYKIQKEKH